MGTKEIILTIILPIILALMILSFQMINHFVERDLMTKNKSYLYKYFAILYPPLIYIILKIKQQFIAKKCNKKAG